MSYKYTEDGVNYEHYSKATLTKQNETEEKPGNVSTITATNVINSSNQIATVKAEIYCETENDYGHYALAQAQYKNNGFSLELPASVPTKYLEFILGDSEEDMTGVTISDKTVKCADTQYFTAYDKDDEEIGSLLYMSTDFIDQDENSNGTVAMWIYVDKDVTINGEYKHVDEYYNEEDITKFNNITFKKGWNIYYTSLKYAYNQTTDKHVYTTTISMQKTSGVTLKWYFESDDYNYAASLKSAKSMSEKKSFFSKLKRDRK